MTPSQQTTSVMNRVDDLKARFSFEPLRQAKFGKPWAPEFDCIVEACVWDVCDRVMSFTHQKSVATMKATKHNPVFFWERKHCIDSMLHKQQPIKVYKTFGSRPAQLACRKLNDRIAALIAPHQRVWIQERNLAAEMMKSAWEYLIA